MISSRYWWSYGWKKFPGPNLGVFRPNFAQNRVFGKYLNLDSYDLSGIAHSDWFQWYLTTNDSFPCSPKYLAPKLGTYLGAKLGPIFLILYIMIVRHDNYSKFNVPKFRVIIRWVQFKFHLFLFYHQSKNSVVKQIFINWMC